MHSQCPAHKKVRDATLCFLWESCEAARTFPEAALHFIAQRYLSRVHFVLLPDAPGIRESHTIQISDPRSHAQNKMQRPSRCKNQLVHITQVTQKRTRLLKTDSGAAWLIGNLSCTLLMAPHQHWVIRIFPNSPYAMHETIGTHCGKGLASECLRHTNTHGRGFKKFMFHTPIALLIYPCVLAPT